MPNLTVLPAMKVVVPLKMLPEATTAPPEIVVPKNPERQTALIAPRSFLLLSATNGRIAPPVSVELGRRRMSNPLMVSKTAVPCDKMSMALAVRLKAALVWKPPPAERTLEKYPENHVTVVPLPNCALNAPFGPAEFG